MKGFLILLTTICLAYACEKATTKDQTADQKALQEMRQEIEDMIKDVHCEDADEWSFAPLGSKACGGPQQYIAYPLSIDTEALLALMAKYTKAEDTYNKKYGISSDCMMVTEPSDVICQEGKPVLIYYNQDNPYAGRSESELEALATEKHIEILKIAQPENCTNASDWKMMDISNICYGKYYLIYHKGTDFAKLTAMVTDYNQIIDVLGPMMRPGISCMLYQKPKGIECKQGKPSFTY